MSVSRLVPVDSRPRERRSGSNPQRVLDFDIEARPLGWYGGDFVHKEVTAIASAWVVDGKMQQGSLHTSLLGELEPDEMMNEFLARYDAADVVTGHYIRGFDLPVLNGELLELGRPSLEPKLTIDTKLDLPKFSGLSKSQENLASVLGVRAEKMSMNMADWRAANRLTPEGLNLVRQRVSGDVRQHIEMLAALRRLGALGPPRVWSPQSSGFGSYHA